MGPEALQQEEAEEKTRNQGDQGTANDIGGGLRSVGNPTNKVHLGGDRQDGVRLGR